MFGCFCKYVPITILILMVLVFGACGDMADGPPHSPSIESREVTRLSGEAINCLVSTRSLHINQPDAPDVELLTRSPCTRLNGLSVSWARGLDDLWMLAGIERVEYGLRIDAELTSLHGLEQLQHVERLDISTSTKLTSLAALSSLSSVGDTLSIQSNHSLTSLEGLESLERVDTLTIAGNDRLASLDALESLDQVRKIIIQQNKSLPPCEVDAFVERFENSAEEILVMGNTGGEGNCE